MRETILEVSHLSYLYEGEHEALHDVSVSIKRGEQIAVIGSNGAGKSTFFLNLNGVLTPREGAVIYEGQAVGRSRKELNRLREHVGIVFQDADSQIIASTVYQEAAFGPMNLGLSREEVKERTDRALRYMDLELEDVEALYRDHALSGKVYEEITKDVNTEVSDDEARIITVQQIYLDSPETAQSVKEQLDAGRDFASVASAYSQNSQITWTFGRGEHDEAYDEAAFALENDQVSGIVETADGYYILKCMDNFDQEATEANKVTMVEKRRDELFESVYEQLVAETPSQFSRKLWEKVHFADWTGELPPDFLAIYEQYLGE